MRKSSLVVALLIFSIVGGLSCANSPFIQITNAFTSISSTIITTDKTWAKANSPYIITEPVGVSSGATLTIEAGVTVNLNNGILVNGTLQARGNDNDPICFKDINGAIIFSPWSSTWNEQSGSGCIIEKAILESAIQIEGSPIIRNCTLRTIIVRGGAPTIANNVVGGFAMEWAGISLQGGNTLVSDNTIYGCGDVGIGISNDGNGMATIERNLIINNNCGIGVWATATIRSNTIVNNTNGIIVRYPSATITQNTIQNNGHNILSMSTSNLDVADNYWGTTDPSKINQTIHDKKNDYNLGTVNFIPYLTAPNHDAPTLTIIHSSTTTPNTEPAPFPSPFTSSDSNQTQSLQPSQENSTATEPEGEPDTQKAPELTTQETVIATLLAVIAGLLIIIGWMHIQTRNKTNNNHPNHKTNHNPNQTSKQNI